MLNFETIKLLIWLAVNSSYFKDCQIIVIPPIRFFWDANINSLETRFRKPEFDLCIPGYAIKEYEKANNKSISYFIDLIPF